MKRFLVVLVFLAVAMIGACIPAFAEDQSECTHQWTKWAVVEESTCIEKGFEERGCLLCGKTEEKTLPLGKHQWTEWFVDYEANCTETGSKERYCNQCDKMETKVIPSKGHAWGNWKVKKKNSPYHTGKKYRECRRCEKEQSRIIPNRKATAKEKASMKTVKRFFVAAKTHNTPKMKTYFAKYPNNYFAYKNSLLGKWSRKYNKTKMSWKIKDVQTSGSNVSVKIKVSYADGYIAFTKGYDKWFSWYLNHMNVSEKKAKNKLRSLMKKEIKKRGTKKATKTITVKCKHTSKGWKIMKPTKELKNIVECNFDKATDDYFGE